MTYSRGARVEWSFAEQPDDCYEQQQQDLETKDWSLGEPWYREDFETMEEAEAFARDRQQEALQQGLVSTVSVVNLDAMARFYEKCMDEGLIPDMRRKK